MPTMLLGSSNSPRTWGGRHDRHCVRPSPTPPEAASLKAPRKEQLYNEAKQKGIGRRSKMDKAELERALGH
ncbi:hypothetical protein GCM10010336_71520 [Streptomyces goshikiensis]|nr:hypothetical protein GCM10010336_71520 [Streptomyces goshikiensis]